MHALIAMLPSPDSRWTGFIPTCRIGAEFDTRTQVMSFSHADSVDQGGSLIRWPGFKATVCYIWNR